MSFMQTQKTIEHEQRVIHDSQNNVCGRRVLKEQTRRDAAAILHRCDVAECCHSPQHKPLTRGEGVPPKVWEGLVSSLTHPRSITCTAMPTNLMMWPLQGKAAFPPNLVQHFSLEARGGWQAVWAFATHLLPTASTQRYKPQPWVGRG